MSNSEDLYINSEDEVIPLSEDDVKELHAAQKEFKADRDRGFSHFERSVKSKGAEKSVNELLDRMGEGFKEL